MRWEYTSAPLAPGWEENLNDHGDEEWELCGVVPPLGVNLYGYLIFKRPKTGIDLMKKRSHR